MTDDHATSITARGLTKRFDSLTAVDGIDFDIDAGEFVVIVGPSGCGKSTTLRMIAGLERITEGELRFDGSVMNDMEPKDRNVAMVFQNYALYPHMSARRNMTFGINSGDRTYSDEEVASRVREAAETLGIVDLLDRKPKQLSGGERQRVAIGRALVRDPDVLLLDEPLSNLDAKLRVEMRTELDELHKELGTTTVYVTHDQTEAMTLGDKVVVMEDGRIQQVDPPQRLYDFPANQFVAGFIGSPPINTIPVEIERDGDDYAVRGGSSDTSFRIPLPRTEDLDALEPGEAVFGIRPEDIHVRENVEFEADSPMTMTVDVTEPLGDMLLVYGTIGDREFRVQLDAHEPVSRGDTLQLVCDPERLHLFDAESGTAIYHSADRVERTAPA